jgi:hypothetical protein
VTERNGVLLALFPANIDDIRGANNTIVPGPGGGVYVAFSRNGFAWSYPTRLLASEVHDSWRTTDYPMEGASRTARTA